MTKGTQRAACELWTHPLGLELRLEAAGELMSTEVCTTQDEVLSTYERWKRSMMEKGWK